jgi:uncharacterized protein YybS (DUF2232 family)
MKRWAPSSRPPVAAWVVLVALWVLSFHPLSAAIAVWLLPVPIILWTAGEKPALSILTATAYGCALWWGHLGWMAVLFALAAYVIGWVMGETLRTADSPFPALITGTLVFVMVQLVSLAFLRWMGFDLFAVLASQMSQWTADWMTALARSGMSPDWRQTASETARLLQTEGLTWLRVTLPGWIAVISLVASAVNLSLARLLWPASQMEGLLRNWRLPYDVIPVYLIALTAVVFHLGESWPVVWQALNSFVLVGQFLLGVQGMAALWRRMEGRPAAGLVWTIVLVLVIVVPLIGTICVLYGMLDCMREQHPAGP